MVCEPDLITTGEAMYMKYIVINSGGYTIGRDYLLNETGESFSILDPQPSTEWRRSPIISGNTHLFVERVGATSCIGYTLRKKRGAKTAPQRDHFLVRRTDPFVALFWLLFFKWSRFPEKKRLETVPLFQVEPFQCHLIWRVPYWCQSIKRSYCNIIRAVSWGNMA